MKNNITLLVALAILIAFPLSAFAQIPVSKAEAEAILKAGGIKVPSVNDVLKTSKDPEVIQGKLDDIKKDAAKQVDAAKEENAKKTSGAIQTEVENGLKDGKTPEEALVEAEAKVADAEDLPPTRIFGHNLYRDRNITSISNGADVRADDNYELGVGDEISINVWGRAEYSGIFKINEEGYIKIEKMPRLYLKGVKYGQVKQKITSQFTSQYNLNSSQIAIALNYSRVITVNIVGEVIHPRSYTLSALNTAVNALAVAQGPSDIGSVRSIRISSAGKPDRTLDLYQYILNPAIAQNFFINNNDYIFVPTIGKVVEIQGAVKRPFKYELLPGENLKSLLTWCGGLNSNAYRASIQIRRIENNQTKTINISLDDAEKNGDFGLKDGDVLSVATIDGNISDNRKKVSIRGAVMRPNDYDLLQNEGLRALIGRSGGLAGNAYKANFQVRRFEKDQIKILVVNYNELEKNNTDFELLRGDVVNITTIDGGTYISSKPVTIQGAISKPGPYQLLMNEGLRALIGRAGGLLVNTYTGNCQIQRIENNEIKLYDVSLKGLDSLKTDFPLERGDIVTLKTIDSDYFTGYGFIDGAVKMPGRYQIEPGKTRISDFLKKAELREDANTQLVYLSRRQKDLSRLYYRISLDEIAKNPNSSENMYLDTKDELFILSLASFSEIFTISVIGAVKNPGSQKFTKNTNLRDAIFRAGGLTFDADHGQIEISRVIMQKNIPVQTIIKKIAIEDTLYIRNDSLGNMKLQPFDQITVRNLPGFELQRYITLNGEVKYPGTYAIVNNKERITDVIKRAGGLTDIAEVRDATFTRGGGNYGAIILDLQAAMRSRRSYYNYVLRPGDVINIPRVKELVSIEGAIDYPTIDSLKRISMAYQPGRNIEYYINEYAGGLSKEKRGRFYLTKVFYPNGAVKKTKRVFLFFNKYPELQPGCVITVGSKPLIVRKEGEKPPSIFGDFDITKATEGLADALKFVTTALTAVLLVTAFAKSNP